MKKIAILGATGHIAKSLINNFQNIKALQKNYEYNNKRRLRIYYFC